MTEMVGTLIRTLGERYFEPLQDAWLSAQAAVDAAEVARQDAMLGRTNVSFGLAEQLRAAVGCVTVRLGGPPSGFPVRVADAYPCRVEGRSAVSVRLRNSGNEPVTVSARVVVPRRPGAPIQRVLANRRQLMGSWEARRGARLSLLPHQSGYLTFSCPVRSQGYVEVNGASKPLRVYCVPQAGYQTLEPERSNVLAIRVEAWVGDTLNEHMAFISTN